jgi:ribulose-5-phosphate 4-epimerase/fuculose-1-phosphate aldolase
MKLTDITTEIKEVAAFLVQKGWADGSAGNISYRLDDDVPNDPNPIKQDIIQPVLPRFSPVSSLTLSISNANAKFRDLAINPRQHCGILKVEDDSFTYFSPDSDSKPSS